jgi:hypothetical protein
MPLRRRNKDVSATSIDLGGFCTVFEEASLPPVAE